MPNVPIDRSKIPPAMWRAIERCGLAPAAVLRQARLPATLHVSDQAAVSTAQFFALWRAVEELSGDPAIGLALAEGTDTSLTPPSLLIASFARDYRDALSRVARFKQLCTPEKLTVCESGGTATITTAWLHAAEPEPAVSVDVSLAALLELGRRGTGHRIVPASVELARADPGGGRHRAYFGGEVRYRAERDALHIRSSDLDRPFPAYNPEMLELLTPALATALRDLAADSSTGAQVKVMLKRRMASGRPELVDVAGDLGVSERTLQRRITQEGTSFRQLMEEARRELGRQMLGQASADVHEIAFLLGYQDTSSFYRAFRGWEGMTPSQWRDRNVPAPGQMH